MPEDDDQGADGALLRFVESFALLLNDAGLARMPARVFAYVLAAGADRYTARELAAGLRVSPAAISGAVRFLVQTGFLVREHAPGARVDHYRFLGDDIWTTILRQRQPIVDHSVDVLTRGMAELPEDHPSTARARETLEFYRFVAADLPHMIERWQEHRRRWLAGDA